MSKASVASELHITQINSVYTPFAYISYILEVVWGIDCVMCNFPVY